MINIEATHEAPTAFETTVTDAPNVWVFSSTGRAYDESQCNDNVLGGDILLVPSEGVAGWLHDGAWPVAATAIRGEFHGLNEDGKVENAPTIEQVLAVWAEYSAAASSGGRCA